VSEAELLSQRIDVIERGYEYLLAYAAQGRQDDVGTELRETLARMHEALTAMQGTISLAFGDLPLHAGTAHYFEAAEHDVQVARGALGLVLSRERIASMLIDNFNASVHVRALLTDLFLIEQALKALQRA
jgi:hypothetical protein